MYVHVWTSRRNVSQLKIFSIEHILKPYNLCVVFQVLWFGELSIASNRKSRGRFQFNQGRRRSSRGERNHHEFLITSHCLFRPSNHVQHEWKCALGSLSSYFYLILDTQAIKMTFFLCRLMFSGTIGLYFLCRITWDVFQVGLVLVNQ